MTQTQQEGHGMGKRIGVVASALGLLVALVVATGALAAGGGTDFTACLGDKGDLTNVAEGLEPAAACKKAAHVVTWNSEGPAGLQGLPGTNGVDGTDGTDGADGEQGIQGVQGPAGGEVPLSTDASGGSGVQTNMQPNLVLNCIIALRGDYPARDGAETSSPFVGEIKWFGGNYAPAGFAFCDGQLLTVSSNTALFSILGTTYGGDGRTTFALPDARGRAILHAGSGPGLTPRRLGERPGTETVIQTVSEMPSHVHTITP
jgi:microcystin-dependent protein